MVSTSVVSFSIWWCSLGVAIIIGALVLAVYLKVKNPPPQKTNNLIALLLGVACGWISVAFILLIFLFGGLAWLR